MEDIGHSPLLKLVVSDSNTPTMSKPEFKIQVPLGDSKITSTVIGEQKLRENVSECYFANVPEDNATEDVTGIDEDSSKTPKFEKREEKLAEAKTREAELTMEDSKDFVLSPVITVTKEEAVLTKGDLKLQKVTVSEDISVRFQHLFKKQTLPGQTVVTQIQKFEYKY